MPQTICPRCRLLVEQGTFCQRCGGQLPRPAYPQPAQYGTQYGQHQRAAKPGMSFKLFVVAFGIGLAILALIMFTSRRLDSSRPRTVATVSPSSDKGTISAIGDRVERGGIALTVVDKKLQRSLSRFETAEKGNVYLVAEVIIENVSRDSAPYNPLYFKLRDWDGIEYRSSIRTEDGALQSGEIFKGDRVRGKVALK